MEAISREQAFRVFQSMADSARASGKVNDAEHLYERTLRIAEKLYGKEHVDLCPFLVRLAEIKEKLGDMEGAERLYERAQANLSLYGKRVLPCQEMHGNCFGHA